MIDSGVDLLLLDCFDTLVELAGARYRARRGVGAFLRHFGERLRVPLVVISDAEGAVLRRALAQAGFADRFAALYHAPDAVEHDVDGVPRKRLDRPLRDFRVAAGRAVFVGDSAFDARAARHHAVPFVRVPGHADREFSFTCLIDGPSRYRSDEYTTRMLRRFRPGGGDAG